MNGRVKERKLKYEESWGVDKMDGEDGQQDPQMILEELKLIESKIQHFDSQLHSITQFGLPLAFTIITVALYIYDKSPFFAGLILLSGFWIMGTVGFIARKNAKYLLAMVELADKREERLGFEITKTIISTRRDKLTGWEDTWFDTKNYKFIKYLFLAGALFIWIYNYLLPYLKWR